MNEVEWVRARGLVGPVFEGYTTYKPSKNILDSGFWFPDEKGLYSLNADGLIAQYQLHINWVNNVAKQKRHHLEGQKIRLLSDRFVEVTTPKGTWKLAGRTKRYAYFGLAYFELTNCWIFVLATKSCSLYLR